MADKDDVEQEDTKVADRHNWGAADLEKVRPSYFLLKTQAFEANNLFFFSGNRPSRGEGRRETVR